MSEGKYKLDLEIIPSEDLYDIDYIKGKSSELADCYSEIVSNKQRIDEISQKSKGNLILRNKDVLYESICALKSLFESCNDTFTDVISVTQALIEGTYNKNVSAVTNMHDIYIQKKQEQQGKVKATQLRFNQIEQSCYRIDSYNIGNTGKKFHHTQEYYVTQEQLIKEKKILETIKRDGEKINKERAKYSGGTHSSSSGRTHIGSGGDF